MGGEGAQETAKQRSPPPRDPVPPPKRPRPAPPPPAPARTQPQVYRPQEQREEEVQEVQEVQTVKAEPREQQNYQENHESAVALEDGYQEEYGDYAQYEGQYDAIDPNTGLPLADGNKDWDQAIESLLMKDPVSNWFKCSSPECTHSSAPLRRFPWTPLQPLSQAIPYPQCSCRTCA